MVAPHCSSQTYLQGNILVLYGMAEDSLEGKFLPSLAIFDKVDSAEAALRNLTHQLVPAICGQPFLLKVG